MITVKYDGRFGNRLFQHFMAVVMAENNGQGIHNPFPTSIDKLKYSHQEESSINELIEVNDENCDTFINAKNISSDIHLIGYFQKKEVVEKFAERKKKLFNDIGEKKPIKGTYIHIRLGDHLPHPERCCPLSYYEKALERVDFDGDLYLSSDSPDHPIVQALMLKYDFKFLDLDEENTILTASRFDNKILSMGSFSWWIGFLGNQKNVICPDLNDYECWCGKIFPSLGWKICCSS